MNLLKILKEKNIWKNYPACKELKGGVIEKGTWLLFGIFEGFGKLFPFLYVGWIFVTRIHSIWHMRIVATIL